MAARWLVVAGRIEKLLSTTAFAVLVVVLFADVFSREATSSGLHWASQIGVWANVAVVMAGFGLASAGGTHLRPRFFDALWPRSWEPVLGFLQHFCMALFCFAIGIVSLEVVLGSYRLGEVEITLFWPIWPVQALLPLAFFNAVARHLIFAFNPGLRPADSGAFEIEPNKIESDKAVGSGVS